MCRSILFIFITVIVIAYTSDILKYANVDHILCQVNKEYCPHAVCEITFKSRQLKKYTWVCDLAKRADIVNVHVTLYYRYRSGYKTFLIDVETDYCAYLSNKIGSALMDIIMDQYKIHATANLLQPCPFLPGTNLSLTDLPLTASLVNNLFIPAGNYKLVVDIRTGAERTAFTLLTIFVVVPAGRTLEDDNMG